MLLTGSTGVIGRHFQGDASRFSYRHFLEGNLDLEKEKVENSLLVHLGGMVGESNIRRDEETAFRANVSGVGDLARHFFDRGGAVFFFASTGHVYGQTPLSGAPELSELDPQSVYAEQKIAAEELLSTVEVMEGQKVVILRIFSVLGASMPDHSLYGAIKRAVRGETKISNPDDIRDFLSPKQVALAIQDLCYARSKITQRVINVCTGIPTSVRDASIRLSALHGHKLTEDSFTGSTSNLPILVGEPHRLNGLVDHEGVFWDPDC